MRLGLMVTFLFSTTMSVANAGPYGDSLTRCLNSETSDSDRATLVRWLVLAYASHPAAKDVAQIREDIVDDVQQAMASYTERLFLNDCLLEAREAARYEGEIAVIEAFKFVAAAAGRELMSEPSVASVLDGYVSLMDGEKFEKEIFGP